VNLAYIREQPGHHSIKLTADTYGHLVPGTNRAVVDRLDDATGRNLYATKERRRESAMSESNAHASEKLAQVYYRQG
jgi:hypothetical protein